MFFLYITSIGILLSSQFFSLDMMQSMTYGCSLNQCLNCEKRSGGTLEARRRRRENRGAIGAEGEGHGEGVYPSPTY